MLRRLAALSPRTVLWIAAMWPLLGLLIAVLDVAIALRPAFRAGGLAAVGFGGSWSFFALLVLPPIAFVAIAAIARRHHPPAS